MPDTQVLIVGAGPTGLNLALWLTRLGIRVRIIDKAAEPGTTSRALVVHARTLEFYRQLGFADEVIRRGSEFIAVNLWVKNQHVGHIELGKLGQGLSPFPFMLIFEQDAHERLLIDRDLGQHEPGFVAAFCISSSGKEILYIRLLLRQGIRDLRQQRSFAGARFA